MEKIVIKVSDLVKKYGNFTAVDSVSFGVRKGLIVICSLTAGWKFRLNEE